MTDAGGHSADGRAGPLSCTVDVGATVMHVRVSGSLGVRTAATLRACVLKCLIEEPAAVLVDLSGLTDATAAGVTVFAALADSAAMWPGTDIILHSARRNVAAVLAGSAVLQHQQVAGDEQQALAHAGRSTGPERLRHMLDADPQAVRHARAVVRQLDHADLDETVRADADIVISELVSNAVTHADAPISLTAAVRPPYLHLCVRDGSALRPRAPELPPLDAERGRGLGIVDALTAGWGVAPTEAGKAVWATIRLTRLEPAEPGR